MPTPTPRELTRSLRNVRAELRRLTSNVDQFVRWMDHEMTRQPSHERAGRIGQQTNHLQMSNDIAKRFGLGKGVRKRKALVK